MKRCCQLMSSSPKLLSLSSFFHLNLLLGVTVLGESSSWLDQVPTQISRRKYFCTNTQALGHLGGLRTVTLRLPPARSRSRRRTTHKYRFLWRSTRFACPTRGSRGFMTIERLSGPRGALRYLALLVYALLICPQDQPMPNSRNSSILPSMARMSLATRP